MLNFNLRGNHLLYEETCNDNFPFFISTNVQRWKLFPSSIASIKANTPSYADVKRLLNFALMGREILYESIFYHRVGQMRTCDVFGHQMADMRAPLSKPPLSEVNSSGTS